MKNSSLLAIGIILFLAAILRIVPVLLGYPNLPLGDSIRELNLINFVKANGFASQDYVYGEFPAFHLFLAGTSWLTGISGFDSLRILIPVLSGLGAVFIYLLFIKWNKQAALLSAFFVATFGPNILWGTNSVRESLGIFFFPAIIYITAKYLENKDLNYLFSLLILVFALLFVHHWTIFLIVLFLVAYAFVSKDNVLFATSLIIYLATLTRLYLSVNSAARFFGDIGSLFLFMLATSLILISIFNLLKKKSLVIYARPGEMINKVNKRIIWACAGVLFVMLVYLAIKDYFVYNYTVYFISSVLLLFFLAFIGVIEAIQSLYKNFVIVGILFFSACTAVFVFHILFSMSSFDPIRIAEFIVYGLALPASFGFLALLNAVTKKIRRGVFVLLIMLFVLSGIFIYPETYFGSSPDSARDLLRYLPIETTYGMKWAYENNGKVYADNGYAMALADSMKNDNAEYYYGYISNYDLMAKGYYEQVNILMLSGLDKEHFNEIMANNQIYSNGFASLYLLTKEQFEEFYKSGVYYKLYGAKL
ncbi:glycosyltransferase family 39 protein [archaeon]|nr:glycosyltransferase family 39 protein [archaeon]